LPLRVVTTVVVIGTPESRNSQILAANLKQEKRFSASMALRHRPSSKNARIAFICPWLMLISS
jgi:hypothetical protein